MDISKELFPLEDLSFEYNTSNKREAYRVKGLDLYVQLNDTKLKVKDLSSTGIGILNDKDIPFEKGMEINLSLLLKDNPLLEGLKAKVIRIKDKTIGCEFVDLDRRKELALDKIVLEYQKQELAKKKENE